MLPPAHAVLIAEGPEGALHELLASRVHVAQALDALERIGKIAAASTGHGHLGQGSAPGLIHRNLSLRIQPLCPYGSKAARSTGTYYSNSFHLMQI